MLGLVGEVLILVGGSVLGIEGEGGRVILREELRFSGGLGVRLVCIECAAAAGGRGIFFSLHDGVFLGVPAIIGAFFELTKNASRVCGGLILLGLLVLGGVLRGGRGGEAAGRELVVI